MVSLLFLEIAAQYSLLHVENWLWIEFMIICGNT